MSNSLYQTKPLKQVAHYSKERIDSSLLNKENYIGTDNLLQDKQGKQKSTYVPTGGTVTKYNLDDTLVANIRPYLKKIWFANGSGGASSDVLTFRVKSGYDPRFFYYSIFRDEFFDHMMLGSKGTRMPRGSKIQILEYPVPDIELEEQRKIAKTLSVLDSKIDLNNRIGCKLEEVLKDIYDYWFVQFDFSNKNAKPYKSSGGKMAWSEELKRDIPEGWVSLSLDQIISRCGTGLNPRKNFKLGSGENYYITIKNVKNGKINFDDSCDKIDEEALNIIDKRSDLQVGDVLFTSIEPVGVTYFIQEKPRNWNINESVFTIRPNYKRISSEYLYMLLSSQEMKVFTKNVSTGSIHKGIRHSILKTFKLPYGGKTIIDQFSVLIRPILKRLLLLDRENQQLMELRNWLLPMLMNGQIKVND